MPRQPRPEPKRRSAPDGAATLDARPEWTLSWTRSGITRDAAGEWHLWECEFCREWLLVPAVLSRRVLSTYLHDHRIDCNGYEPAHQHEGTEEQQ